MREKGSIDTKQLFFHSSQESPAKAEALVTDDLGAVEDDDEAVPEKEEEDSEGCEAGTPIEE